jgi:hypothetical protein
MTESTRVCVCREKPAHAACSLLYSYIFQQSRERRRRASFLFGRQNAAQTNNSAPHPHTYIYAQRDSFLLSFQQWVEIKKPWTVTISAPRAASDSTPRERGGRRRHSAGCCSDGRGGRGPSERAQCQCVCAGVRTEKTTCSRDRSTTTT